MYMYMSIYMYMHMYMYRHMHILAHRIDDIQDSDEQQPPAGEHRRGHGHLRHLHRQRGRAVEAEALAGYAGWGGGVSVRRSGMLMRTPMHVHIHVHSTVWEERAEGDVGLHDAEQDDREDDEARRAKELDNVLGWRPGIVVGAATAIDDRSSADLQGYRQ